MVDIKKDRIRRCFQLILEKRYSDARDLLKSSENYQGSEINLGTKFAIEGIISFSNDKSKEGYLKDIDQIKRLRQFFKRKISSIWNGDFDKEYFETWIYFLNFLIKQMKSKGSVNSVINYPSEEPKSYKTT